MLSVLPLLLLTNPIATSSSAATRLGDQQPFSVDADRLYAEPKSRRYRAEGSVVVRRPGAMLFADVVTFDETTGIAIAEGHVTAVEGTTVLSCDRVEMRVPELVGGITNAELRIKKGPAIIGDDPNASAIRLLGPDELIVEADRFDRKSSRSFDVQGGSFTACDCGEGEAPSWRIRASEASIDLDSGAWLEWPVFYVKDIPILALPIYYVPLGARRSGILTPHFSSTPVTGAEVSVPLYLAFGESWDTTFEPTYYATRGPGLGLELRYAPSLSTSGSFNANTILDFGDPDPANPGTFDKSRSLADAIPRFGVSGHHVTDFSSARLHAELNLLGDPRFQSDFADEFLSRQQEYGRSRVTLTSVSERFRLAGTVQVLQDLRPEVYFDPSAPTDLREVSLFSADIPGAGSVRQRLFELRMDAAPYTLPTPFPLIGDAGFSLQLFGATSKIPTRFLRADFRPEVRAPFDLFGVVLEPFVAARVTVWTGRDNNRAVAANRLALITGGQLFVEFTRFFGKYLHRIRPSAEYLAIPLLSRSGEGAFETFDEIDLLERVSQARLRLLTDLVHGTTGRRIAALDVWFGGDLGLPGGKSEGASEVVAVPFLSVAPTSWPLTIDISGLAALDAETKRFTELLAGLSIGSKRGDRLSLSFGKLDDQMPRYTFVAPEELVPSATIDRINYEALADYQKRAVNERPNFVPWSAFTGLAIGAQVRPFDPLTLAFDMTLAFGDDIAVYGGTEAPSIIRNTRALIRWDSPCECFSAYATASTARDRDGFSFDFGLDLARLGGVSTP